MSWSAGEVSQESTCQTGTTIRSFLLKWRQMFDGPRSGAPALAHGRLKSETEAYNKL